MINVIIGKQGQGKTTLAKSLIKSSLKNIIIFDMTGEYHSLKNFNNINTFTKLKDLINNNFFKIVFHLKKPEHLKYLIPIIMDKKNLEIYFDEAHIIMREKITTLLIRYSRQLFIDLFFISHRIYDMPVLIRGMLNKLILFRLQSVEDQEYLKKFLGNDLTDIIKGLDQFCYIEIDIQTGVQTKKSLTLNFK